MIKCPYCGSDNPEEATFCRICGEKLSAAKTIEETESLNDMSMNRATNEALLYSANLKSIKKLINENFMNIFVIYNGVKDNQENIDISEELKAKLQDI